MAAGYEAHLNFSPVVVHDRWPEAWATLYEQIDSATDSAANRQLACEVILLTHNEALHDINLGWHAHGEQVLWQPEIQQRKRSQSGQRNVRYRTGLKHEYVEQFTQLLASRLHYCRVRYAF